MLRVLDVGRTYGHLGTIRSFFPASTFHGENECSATIQLQVSYSSALQLPPVYSPRVLSFRHEVSGVPDSWQLMAMPPKLVYVLKLRLEPGLDEASLDWQTEVQESI